MIRKVTIRRFKRFEEVELELTGNVVLAGPNNGGKTTILQALAAWDLAFRKWKGLFDYQKHNGHYTWAPISRPAFTAVPLRTFEMLWRDRDRKQPVEISVVGDRGWTVTMELKWDSTEQIYVRPQSTTPTDLAKGLDVPTVFIPPMSGLDPDEGLWGNRERVSALLGQGRTGEVLRNLIYEASTDEKNWADLTKAVKDMFGLELKVPQVGANIVAEYIDPRSATVLDIASAGSGFLQVLLLLSFLVTRPGSVLLLDEPDAHLHVILQDAIYGELKAIAARTGSKLIIATHSEVIIESVPVEDLWHLFKTPRRIRSKEERRLLAGSLGRLSNADVLAAEVAPGVLYVEGSTDLDVLREFARVLGHRAYGLLSTQTFWKPTTWQPRPDATGISAREHFEALQLVNPNQRGLVLIDGDGDDRGEQSVTGSGFQRLRWRRYEIESYLIHPDALARFVELTLGPGAGGEAAQRVREHFERTMPPAFLADVFQDALGVTNVKARTDVLPAILSAGGLPGLHYAEYFKLAAAMRPEEIHPEVKEKLDLLCKAFGVPV